MSAYTQRSALQEPQTLEEAAALLQQVMIDREHFTTLVLMLEGMTKNKEITRELFRLNKSIDAGQRRLGKYEGRVAERNARIIKNTTRKSPKNKRRSRSTL